MQCLGRVEHGGIGKFEIGHPGFSFWAGNYYDYFYKFYHIIRGEETVRFRK
ncbi:MAG: hypothetical protein Fur0016_31200 [Anaerolineales bacterium]